MNRWTAPSLVLGSSSCNKRGKGNLLFSMSDISWHFQPMKIISSTVHAEPVGHYLQGLRTPEELLDGQRCRRRERPACCLEKMPVTMAARTKMTMGGEIIPQVSPGEKQLFLKKNVAVLN